MMGKVGTLGTVGRDRTVMGRVLSGCPHIAVV